MLPALCRGSMLLGASALASSLLTACLATAEPIRTVRDDTGSAEFSKTPRSERTLVIMLPGLGDEPEDYIANGFVDDMQRHGREVDVVVVDAHLGYYRERELLTRLREDVFEPAHAERYPSIWIVGISMGGMGALLSAREFGEQVDGVVLLSPFLGRRPALRRISAAGGPGAWEPPAETSSDYTVELWRWLKAYPTEAAKRAPIYLGYGTQERNRSHWMLAELLPSERVVTIEGGHEWDTWRAAWAKLLAMPTFEDPALPREDGAVSSASTH